MRRLLALLALVFAAPAAAATIHGTAHGDSIVGTQAADTIAAGAGNDFVQAAFGGVDHVDCGAGFDVVSADLADVVAANCEVVSRRLSVDLSTNPASQHETAVEPDDAAWGSTVVATYQLGRFSGGASSNIGFATSSDAGRTWQRGVLPGVTVESSPAGTQTSASDPTVAYDSLHGVWLIGTLTLEPGASHVLVARSTDGLQLGDARRRRNRPDARQGLDHVRQRNGEPASRPLLPRVHRRRKGHHRQRVERRRRRDVVAAGDGREPSSSARSR